VTQQAVINVTKARPKRMTQGSPWDLWQNIRMSSMKIVSACQNLILHHNFFLPEIFTIL
jgi:hypothetical protein